MSEPSSRQPETPLESWKAIAAYLGRDVRTAKRWETSEGLPVHRHRHLARSSVYAFPSELDEWRATRLLERQPAADTLSGRRTRALGFAFVGIVALLSIGDGQVLNTASPAAQERGIVVTQVWAGPEVDAQGTPTPDGRSLIFTDWSTGDIALRDLATGETQRLTEKGPFASSMEYGQWPVVSPDGRQAAYLWFNGNDFDLRVIPLTAPPDGRKPRVVLHHEEVPYLQPFAWSPDSGQLVTLVSRRDGTHQIALITVPDGSMQVLKSLEWRYPTEVSLSPDGRYIAYDVHVRQGSPDRDIFVLDVEGRQERTLVQHPAIDYGPQWTPDGKTIVFASDRRGTTGLWAILVAEGKPTGDVQLVMPDVGNVLPLGFSRDGSYYYGVRTGTEDVYVADLNPETGELMNAPRRLTERFIGSNLAGAWSPDGRRLAYVSRRGPLNDAPGSMAVVIRSLETGEERDLFSTLSFDRRRPIVRWFPDSQSLLVWAHDARGRESLHRMNAQTGATAPIRTGLGFPGFVFQPPALSPDGRTVYYFKVNGLRSQSIVAYDINAGREVEILRTTPLLSLALSRDGKRLAFLTSGRRNSLSVIPASGGTPRELYRAQHDDDGVSPQSLEWTHDDRLIVFVRRRTDERSQRREELWRIPSEGGEPQRVFSMDGFLFPTFPSIDPTGRRLAFTAGQSGLSTVWVMRNFQPQDARHAGAGRQ